MCLFLRLTTLFHNLGKCWSWFPSEALGIRFLLGRSRSVEWNADWSVRSEAWSVVGLCAKAAGVRENNDLFQNVSSRHVCLKPVKLTGGSCSTCEIYLPEGWSDLPLPVKTSLVSDGIMRKLFVCQNEVDHLLWRCTFPGGVCGFFPVEPRKWNAYRHHWIFGEKLF